MGCSKCGGVVDVPKSITPYRTAIEEGTDSVLSERYLSWEILPFLRCPGKSHHNKLTGREYPPASEAEYWALGRYVHNRFEKEKLPQEQNGVRKKPERQWSFRIDSAPEEPLPSPEP